jgi:hypothetical protein
MSTGLGVMIQSLGGNEETVNAVKNALGKTIKDVKLVGDVLIISFEDGSGIRITDDGQSCCEHRYMNTDDDLTDFEGATLNDMELSDGPTDEEEYSCVESQFLKISTSKGGFTVVNYNSHNGYYGGFWITVREV